MQSKYLQIAIRAVKVGGKLAMKYFDNPPNVRTKIMKADAGKSPRDGNKSWPEPLSDVDVQIEEKIKKIITKHFPSHNFKGEETKHCITSSNYTWFLDPISSSTNYLHHTPHFAVSLSLTKNRLPILGVVLDPFYNELFYAEKNCSAYLGKQKLKVSSCSNLEQAFGLPLKKIRACFDIYNERHIGSSALNLAWIAAGRLDFFVADRVDLYSQLGPVVLIQEAGGKMTDFAGKNLTTDSKTIIASNGHLHKKILKSL
ncbi:MAG: inositol monophosphatase family protein [Candidatus Jacksonbacteria bacterium]